jgi:hypothetical protein
MGPYVAASADRAINITLHRREIDFAQSVRLRELRDDRMFSGMSCTKTVRDRQTTLYDAKVTNNNTDT